MARNTLQDKLKAGQPANGGVKKASFNKPNLESVVSSRATVKKEAEAAKTQLAAAEARAAEAEKKLADIYMPEGYEFKRIPCDKLINYKDQLEFFDDIEETIRKAEDKVQLNIAERTALQKFNSLKVSIAEQGQAQPIIARAIENSDMYEIIAGHSRVTAFRKLGLTDIEAFVYPVGGLDDEKAADLFVDTNWAQRGSLPAKAKARCMLYKIKQLKKNFKKGDEPIYVQFANKYAVEKSSMYSWTKVADMEEGFLKLIDAQVIGINTAAKIASLSLEDQKKLLVECEGNITDAKIKDIQIKKGYDIAAIIAAINNDRPVKVRYSMELSPEDVAKVRQALKTLGIEYTFKKS